MNKKYLYILLLSIAFSSQSKVGTTAIAQAADNGQTLKDVKFYSAADGLSTANATFQFASGGNSYSYTTSGTFTMANGTSLESQAIRYLNFKDKQWQ